MHDVAIRQEIIDRVLARRGRLHIFDKLDPHQTALVVIDMQTPPGQRDRGGGNAESPRTSAAPTTPSAAHQRPPRTRPHDEGRSHGARNSRPRHPSRGSSRRQQQRFRQMRRRRVAH